MKIKQTIQLPLGTILVIVASLLVISVVFLGNVVRAESSNQHLITIHEGGTTKSIISDQPTLREAFQKADIAIDDNDMVEPNIDQELVGNDYQVNIYRARPITIVDGQKQVRVMTAYQTPKQIVESASMVLRDEDTTSMSLSTDMVADGASMRLDIDRATAINLELYGKKEVVYTQAENVGDFLKEKDITLGSKDSMSAKPMTPITANMSLQVWRDGKQTVTQDEEIAPPVETIQDADRPVGYKKITTAGTPGKRSVTYEIIMKNGKETSRKKIQSVVIDQPTKQVVVVGAKQKTFGGSCGDWIAGAGITDTANASYLIGVESGCNPNAVNASSGACGVGQALPCGKTGCEMGDGACQTRWMNGYVKGRYGSWQAAADHHRATGWY